MVEVDHAEVALAARRQRGNVTHVQLEEAGRGRGARHHDVKTGRLHRRHRGVYAVGHDAAAAWADENAAVLAAGAGAVLSYVSAARLWGLLPHRPGALVHITFTGPRADRPGIKMHRTRHLDPRDSTFRHDLPVTTTARTLLDLAEQVERRTLEWAFNEALAQQIVTRAEIRALLGRSPGRRGAAALRALLEPADGFTRNKAERAMRDLNRAANLPRARYNERVGPYELDVLYPGHAFSVEVDGYGPHSTPAAFERDRRRDADLKANYGIDVMRIPWRMLRDEATAVAALAAAALARAKAARPTPSPGTTRA